MKTRSRRHLPRNLVRPFVSEVQSLESRQMLTASSGDPGAGASTADRLSAVDAARKAATDAALATLTGAQNDAATVWKTAESTADTTFQGKQTNAKTQYTTAESQAETTYKSTMAPVNTAYNTATAQANTTFATAQAGADATSAAAALAAQGVFNSATAIIDATQAAAFTTDQNAYTALVQAASTTYNAAVATADSFAATANAAADSAFNAAKAVADAAYQTTLTNLANTESTTVANAASTRDAVLAAHTVAYNSSVTGDATYQAALNAAISTFSALASAAATTYANAQAAADAAYAAAVQAALATDAQATAAAQATQAAADHTADLAQQSADASAAASLASALATAQAANTLANNAATTRYNAAVQAANTADATATAAADTTYNAAVAQAQQAYDAAVKPIEDAFTANLKSKTDAFQAVLNADQATFNTAQTAAGTTRDAAVNVAKTTYDAAVTGFQKTQNDANTAAGNAYNATMAAAQTTLNSANNAYSYSMSLVMLSYMPGHTPDPNGAQAATNALNAAKHAFANTQAQANKTQTAAAAAAFTQFVGSEEGAMVTRAQADSAAGKAYSLAIADAAGVQTKDVADKTADFQTAVAKLKAQHAIDLLAPFTTRDLADQSALQTHDDATAAADEVATNAIAQANRTRILDTDAAAVILDDATGTAGAAYDNTLAADNATHRNALAHDADAFVTAANAADLAAATTIAAAGTPWAIGVNLAAAAYTATIENSYASNYANVINAQATAIIARSGSNTDVAAEVHAWSTYKIAVANAAVARAIASDVARALDLTSAASADGLRTIAYATNANQDYKAISAARVLWVAAEASAASARATSDLVAMLSHDHATDLALVAYDSAGADAAVAWTKTVAAAATAKTVAYDAAATTWAKGQWPASNAYFTATYNAEAARLDTTWHAYATYLKAVSDADRARVATIVPARQTAANAIASTNQTFTVATAGINADDVNAAAAANVAAVAAMSDNSFQNVQPTNITLWGTMLYTASAAESGWDWAARTVNDLADEIRTSDWLDLAANASAGFADTITFGATWYVRQWTGVNGGINADSMAYAAGRVGGQVEVFALGFFSCGGGWAGSMASGYESISTIVGMAQSTVNLANGNGSFADALSFLPLAGKVLGRASGNCFVAGTRVVVADPNPPIVTAIDTGVVASDDPEGLFEQPYVFVGAGLILAAVAGGTVVALRARKRPDDDALDAALQDEWSAPPAVPGSPDYGPRGDLRYGLRLGEGTDAREAAEWAVATLPPPPSRNDRYGRAPDPTPRSAMTPSRPQRARGSLAASLALGGILLGGLLLRSPARPDPIAGGPATAGVSASAPTPEPGHSTKCIEDIKVGDRVLAWDEATGSLAPKRVADTYVRITKSLRVLEVRTPPDQRVQQIKTTDEHPFWVEGRGWVEAGKLAPGQLLRQADGSPAEVATTHAEPHPEGVTVYNFQVEDSHTYYVAQSDRDRPVLVHNAGAAYRAPADGYWYHGTSGTQSVLSDGLDSARSLDRHKGFYMFPRRVDALDYANNSALRDGSYPIILRAPHGQVKNFLDTPPKPVRDMGELYIPANRFPNVPTNIFEIDPDTLMNWLR